MIPRTAFLNLPYDNRRKNIYLAFISGVAAYGLVPRATLEIPGGKRRLERIFELIKSCPYSFHDLSRVQLDRKPPPTPRFNMPFELGLAVAWQHMKASRTQTWFVFESVRRRLNKSLSDLEGSDPYIHDGTVGGVFRELNNALVRSVHRPTIAQMSAIYEGITKASPRIRRDAGARTLFEARVFSDLVTLARLYAERHIASLKTTGSRRKSTRIRARPRCGTEDPVRSSASFTAPPVYCTTCDPGVTSEKYPLASSGFSRMAFSKFLLASVSFPRL